MSNLEKHVLFLIFCILIALLLGGCSISFKHYDLRPDLNYLQQDNDGIMICRLDAQGQEICERSLDFYGDDDLWVVRKHQWVK